MAKNKGGLGRGLDALFNDNSVDRNTLIEVSLIDIEPNRDQPRKSFDDKALSELANSIKEHGLLQPIIVKPLAGGTYRIIAGERRWRASRMAGLSRVPVIIKDFDDREVMEVALIENLQREDLNPVEEAMGYRTLMESFGLTQEQVAVRVGKSRSAVANALRLLALDEKELELLKNGSLSAGHARAILMADDPLVREQLVEMALNGLSVRDLERVVRASKQRRVQKHHAAGGTGFYAEVELALMEAIHRKVKVTKLGEDHGMISIEFYGDEELRDIAARLGRMH